MNKIAEIILAAGSSSRMGRPKQLLPWENTTLIEHTIAQSRGLDMDTFVVLGANCQKIKPIIDTPEIRIVYNRDWHRGMGSSIQTGIKAMLDITPKYQAVLIRLADQPFIDAVLLKQLLVKYNKSSTDIIGTDIGTKIVVPAIFPVSYFDELITLKEDYGARFILKKYKKNIQTIQAVEKIVDIDTEEDYQRLISSKH